MLITRKMIILNNMRKNIIRVRDAINITILRMI